MSPKTVSVPFTPEQWEAWYRVMLVGLADPPEAALKAWRKTQIGRGNVLRAKEFDTALRAAKAFGDAPVMGLMAWMSQHHIAPLFVVADGHKWTVGEKAFIESVRMRGLHPDFLSYDEEAMFAIPGPATSPRDILRLGWPDV